MKIAILVLTVSFLAIGIAVFIHRRITLKKWSVRKAKNHHPNVIVRRDPSNPFKVDTFLIHTSDYPTKSRKLIPLSDCPKPGDHLKAYIHPRMRHVWTYKIRRKKEFNNWKMSENNRKIIEGHIKYLDENNPNKKS
jgi:hypothetical protein